jgi:glycosyltransferase involved in cell wall biosynthesis
MPSSAAGSIVHGSIWIDVEDIFAFAQPGRTPTGIQRLSFELCRALHEGYPGRIRLVRQTREKENFVETSWLSLDQLFHKLAAPIRVNDDASDAPPALDAPALDAGAFNPGWRGPVKAVLRPCLCIVPFLFRRPLIQFARMQARAIYALGDMALLALQWPFRAASPAAPAAISPEPANPPSAPPEAPWRPRTGDVLLAAGAAWFHADYPALLRATCRRRGVRVAVLIYDIIPLRRPEWCDRQHADVFRRWLDAMLPGCDSIFTISHASAEDVGTYAAERGIALRDVIHPIPIGTGFQPHAAVEAPPRSRTLPAPGSYVLFVSTIEIRKNHALLFRVWRRLLEQRPADDVPTLVFAGRVGWMVADFMQQLRNCDFLGGKIRLIEQPDDHELEILYRGCLFTLFPSFYEGWGLPVTESLAFGKPCVIANRTSLPEAGGHLARYFDPDHLDDALDTIQTILDDRPGLAAWETRIIEQFRPTPWLATAHAVMSTLHPTLPLRRSA